MTWEDVFLIVVAYYSDLTSRHSKGFYAKKEDAWVWLSDANSG